MIPRPAQSEHRVLVMRQDRPFSVVLEHSQSQASEQVEQTAGAAQSPAPSTVGPSASQHPAALKATTIRRVAGEALVFRFQ